MKNENANKAIPFPVRFLTGVLVLTVVVLAALVWFTFDSYQKGTAGQLRNLRIQELRGTIVHLDEVLTMSAHMAATTGDSDWERRYRQFEPQLEASIREAAELTAHLDSAQAAGQMDAANLKLVEMENQVFTFVRAGDSTRAKAILFSDAYKEQKNTYTEGTNKLIQRLEEQLSANELEKQREAFLAIIAVAVCIVLLFFTWLWVLRSLNFWKTTQYASLDALTKAEEELSKLNDQLEKRVEDRTRSLLRTRKELEKFDEKLQQSNREMRESESLLAASQRITHLGSWVIDLSASDDGRPKERWSDEHYRIFGFKPGEVEITDETFYNSIHPDDRELLRAAIERKEPFDIEHRIILPDGDERVVHAMAEVVFDAATGNPLKLLGSVQDITERKLADESLRESEEKFQQLASAVTDVFYMNTPDLTQVLYVSPAYEQIWGRSTESLYANPNEWGEAILPGERNAVFAAFSALATGSQKAEIEFQIVRPDGEVRWIFSRGFPVRDADGKVIRITGIASDITEQKRTEAALEESEASFKSLFDTANDALMVVNEGVFIDCNHRAEILFGAPKEWILGRTPMELSPPLQPDGRLSSEKAPMYIGPAMQGVPQFFEWQHSRRDGTVFDTEISLNNVHFRGEIHLQAVVRDITERKRADAELQDSHRRVEDIVNSVEGIVWEADAQTFIFSFVSAQAEQILGYPSHRWIDEPTFWSEHIHPDDRDVAVNFCVDATNKMLPHEFEYRMLARDGRDVWIKDTVTVLSENGRPTILRGIMMDITEQKRTEAALEESDASFKALFETASDAIFVTKGGAFQACNPAAEKLFGCTREEMLDRRSAADFSPLRQSDGRLSSEKAGELKAAAIKGEPQFFEWTHNRLDGTPFDAEVNLTRVDVGGTTQVQATVRDITERKRVEEETTRLNSEIETQRERLKTIIGNVQGVVWETKTKFEKGETSLRFDFISDYVETMLGYSASECLAKPNFWLDIIHPDDRSRTEQIVKGIFAGREDGTVEFRWIARDGHEVWIESRNTIIRDDAGKAIGLRGIAVDISQRKSFEEQLTHQALHDPLTKLGNRVLFRDRVEHAIDRTRRKHSPIAVLFLDLDNFKSVNDSLGHASGDQLLVSVTERLQACLRTSDTPARFGGDEFAVLLEDLEHVDQAAFIAERIRNVLCAPFSVAGTEIFIGSSIGIAVTVDGRETPEELLRNADVAMYMSKNNGKDRYTIFENEMHDVLIKRVRLESDMRSAIEKREFEVYYQPIMDLHSERVMGMEALVRWNHPQHGLIPPLDFIPLAEETGLIIPLGKWILERACYQARDWQTKHRFGDDLSITVNVASRQFLDEGLLETVEQALAKSKLPPHSLILEITESTMLSNTESTIKKLNELKRLGIRFAIDDFGTGYSSLSYLQRFPVDILKIDKSFIDNIASDKAGSAVARAIITMSATLNLKTIAEGIETHGQQTELQNLGCELGQGYHFAKPLRASDMDEFLRNSQTDETLPILPIISNGRPLPYEFPK